MKLAIMQPYFLPYIGYFQLIGAADIFVLYDNIKYTKKGWINRNRMLLNGTDAVFSLPLKKASDSSEVIERELAGNFERHKLLSQFRGAYARAPQFAETYPLLERIVLHEERNLFLFIRHSVGCICESLGIGTKMIASSEIGIDHGLKGQDRVIALCRALGADTYINPIGGVGLYSRDEFSASGIDLKFLRSEPVGYKQFDNEHVPWLSIIDVMMFNAIDQVRQRVRRDFVIS